MLTIHQKELNLIQSKGNDYADSEDVLKNFKAVSEICKILNIDSRTQYGTHLFYIVLKLQRAANLLQEGKTAQNESVEDTLIDLRTYTGLLINAVNE